MHETLLQSYFVLLFLHNTIFSQDTELNVEFISKELKANADAVLRLSDKIVTVAEVDKLIISNKRIVTVLNKRGNK